MAHHSIILLLCLLLGGGAFAAEVISLTATQRYVGVSHEVARRWHVGDSLCILQMEKEIACGEVVKVSTKLAVVKVSSRSGEINRGDRVEHSAGDRKPTAVLLDKMASKGSEPVAKVNLSGGVSFGLNYFFPMLHVQHLIGTQFALGLEPLYFRGSSAAEGATLSALGVFVTGNYYQNGYFRGLWGQVGAGFHRISLSQAATTETATVPAFFATLGWRGYWDMGLNIGVGAGGQYVADPNFSEFDLNSSGIKPLVLLDVGISF